jgi:hypothetical protein
MLLRFIPYCAKERRPRSNPIAARALSTHLTNINGQGMVLGLLKS